jgi:hypothetical protein
MDCDHEWIGGFNDDKREGRACFNAVEENDL